LNWRSAAALCALTLSACAHEPAALSSRDAACRTPMPLELRLRRMEARIAEAYAGAPALSEAEKREMDRIQQCMAVGDECYGEHYAAVESGLARRDMIRSAAFDVPDLVRRAIALPLGAARTDLLLTAVLAAEEAEDALRAYEHDEGEDGYGAGRLDLVSADAQQAIICDAADLAAGRTPMAYDPNAETPDGP
jgi:hypothetical protein